MIACATTDVAGTQAVAAEVAALVVDGDLLVLVGDLGAGKTHFTQGFARAVGVDEPVTSPTFTLANRYEGDIVVNHLDAYRIEQFGDAEDLAIPELLEDGVTLVEWGNNSFRRCRPTVSRSGSCWPTTMTSAVSSSLP